MEKNTKQSIFLTVFLVLALVVAAAVPYATGAQASAKKLDGKTIFETKCLKCHKIAKFQDQQNTRKEWVLILSRMQRGTCDINDNELEALADYLAKAYGP